MSDTAKIEKYGDLQMADDLRAALESARFGGGTFSARRAKAVHGLAKALLDRIPASQPDVREFVGCIESFVRDVCRRIEQEQGQ